MGHTRNFFKSKKGWSCQKDEIFERYLEPYISIILNTYKPVVIVDCFAGKGKYDDGKTGSPIIIANHIRTVLASDKQNKNLRGLFIESNYAKELEVNLRGYKNCELLLGTFKENIDKILALDSSCNLFLYIDPYGIKCLDFQQFERIRAKNFFSLEMILNFNSFGFLREGCRLLHLNYESLLNDDQGGEEYELDEANTIERMNDIANGIYWQDIIRKK